MEHLENLDLAQKAKIKWGVEGDENSKFFHAVVNCKRRRTTIWGIMKEGLWIDNLDQVNVEFYNHFWSRFAAENIDHPSIVSESFLKLSVDHISFLHAPFTSEEIKTVVWDCGSDKAPGPDGFIFGFFFKHY